MLGIKEDRLISIPLINHLQECAEIERLIYDNQFRKRCQTNHLGDPITALNFVWYGRSMELLTILLQRAILGTESFLRGAVLLELVQRKQTNSKTRDYITDPFMLNGGGTANNYYNKLPALIDKSYSLQRVNPKLWVDVKNFYKETRNPLFHGHLLNTNDPESLKPYLTIIKNIFGWIDGWFTDRVGSIMPVQIKRFWPDTKK